MSDDNGNDSDDEFSFVVVPYPQGEDQLFDLQEGADDDREEMETDHSEVEPRGEGTGEVYDEDLPITHSYLGDMDRVSGRTIYPDNSIVTLPLLPGCPGAWVPGQTFPLMVKDQVRCDLLRKVVTGDHTFGCRARSYNYQNLASVPQFGTTCEIYEFSDELSYVSIKAKVRQRFKKLGKRRSEGPIVYADCQILPEIILKKPLSNFQLPSLDRVRQKCPRKCQLREAYTSPWPPWVFTQYDTDYLRGKVSNQLQFLKQGLKKDKDRPPMPKDPTELSFWLASYLGADERLKLIQLNSPIRRLRWILSLVMQCRQYHCLYCDNLIGHQKDFFAMSAEGAQSSYVNPSGYVHDTITLSKVSHLITISNPSTEYSWFPGYAWQIAVCNRCQRHIGWKFTSQKLVPNSFWGLTRQSLTSMVAWSDAPGDDESACIAVI